MIEREQIDRLNKLADILASFSGSKFFGVDTPPFDISRPNLHDTKAEFAAELALVSSALKHVESMSELFKPKDTENGTEIAVHLSRVVDALNLAVRNGTRKRKIRDGLSRDLVVQNFRDTGFVENFTAVLIDMELALRKRQVELKDQEALFWKSANRSRNPYPYAIALRFARFYISQTGKLPKFGTTSHDGKASTIFGNHLLDVFDILGIEANIRGPATYAVREVVAEVFRNVPSGGDVAPDFYPA